IPGCSIDKLSINFRSCKKPSTALSHISHIWSKYPPRLHHLIIQFRISLLHLSFSPSGSSPPSSTANITLAHKLHPTQPTTTSPLSTSRSISSSRIKNPFSAPHRQLRYHILLPSWSRSE